MPEFANVIDPINRYGCDACGNLFPMLEPFQDDFERIFLLRNEVTDIHYILDEINSYHNISITKVLDICHRQIGWELSFLLAYWLLQNLQRAWVIKKNELDISEFLTANFFVKNPIGVLKKKDGTFLNMSGMFFTPTMLRNRLSHLFIMKYQTQSEVHYLLNLED